MMTSGQGPALGSVWRITAKDSDFYLDGFGPNDVAHLSLHGPGEKHAAHRFHMKLSQRLESVSIVGQHVLVHGIPRRGQPFDGKRVAEDAWLVARIRWSWHLQSRRFRTAALHRGVPPQIDGSFQKGVRLGTLLRPGKARDVDLFVSYGEPYWPPVEPGLTAHGETRLGPLGNRAGMYLTGVSAHRSVDLDPAPDSLDFPLPGAHEHPSRFLGVTLDPADDFYWLTETITSREFIDLVTKTVAPTANRIPPKG